jgi:hypothetical protein
MSARPVRSASVRVLGLQELRREDLQVLRAPRVPADAEDGDALPDAAGASAGKMVMHSSRSTEPDDNAVQRHAM